jgi:hypothetical protein
MKYALTRTHMSLAVSCAVIVGAMAGTASAETDPVDNCLNQAKVSFGK